MDVYAPPYAMTPDGDPLGPHAAQRRFHRLRAKYRMFQGGIGSGKSHAGAVELMTAIVENAEYSTATTKRRGRSKEGLLYLVGAPTYDIVEVGPWHHVTQWLDGFEIANGYALDARRLVSHPRKIKLVSGDVIKFLSLDKPQKWAAATAAGFWMDESELCDDPLGAFKMLQGRVRDARADKRFGIVTSSPRGNRGCARHFRERTQIGDASYGLVTASTGQNPGNAAGYVEDLIATMSEREKKQQIEGLIVADEGAVYGLEFDAVASLADRWRWRSGREVVDHLGSRKLETNLAIDWGGHYHCLMIEHDPSTGLDVVFDELAIDGIQVEDFCGRVVEQLRRKWGVTPEDVTGAWCDHEPLDGRREAYRWWRGRVHSRRVRDNQDRTSRIDTVRWRLRDADGKRNILFAPELRKTPSNRGAIASMENYVRAARRVQGDTVILDRPAQDSIYSHACDALGYYCWLRYSGQRWHDERRVEAA